MALPAAIVAALGVSSVGIAAKVLLGLGIGFVTYTGADFAIGEFEDWLDVRYAGMAANTLAMAKIAGFTTGFAMVLSAFGVYIGIKVATGAFSKLSITPPS